MRVMIFLNVEEEKGSEGRTGAPGASPEGLRFDMKLVRVFAGDC